MKTKTCPACNRELSIERFSREGRGRVDKSGEPKRRRICSSCRSKGAKPSPVVKANANVDTDVCVVCRTTCSEDDFSEVKRLVGGHPALLVCNNCLPGMKREEVHRLLSELGRFRECIFCNDLRNEDDFVADTSVCKECHARLQSGEIAVDDSNEVVAALITALVQLARYEPDRLETMSRGEFIRKTNAHDYVLDDLSFDMIKERAREKLDHLGLYHPPEESFGPGTYLIVGDSHGKHTKTKMFNLLKHLNKVLEFDRIIHLGHILDDDNVMSYWWGDFDNLSVLAKIEELGSVVNEKRDNGYGFEIVRDRIHLGELVVRNQDLISDYVKTYIGSLDQQIFSYPVVVNCHRHELATRCVHQGNIVTAAPGCLCEKHIVRTIKQIDFTDGYQVRDARAEGFIKYRRMKDMYEFWEQGLLVVHVDEKGKYTIVPCRIKQVDGEYATSYGDKIITETKVLKPEIKIFINSDIHCDAHDNKVLDVQDRVVKDYSPDVYVNLGDMQNNESINHHVMDRGGTITRCIIEENAAVCYLLKKMAAWADVRYLIYGNHERFVKDFYEKFPQLEGLVTNLLLSSSEEEKYNLIDHKEVLTLGGMHCIHGDMRMYGQSGRLMEKSARTFGGDTVIGHLHHPAIRFGCYMIGLSGKLDQGYNEPRASSWMHGFGLCNQYKGVSWVSSIAIEDNRVMLGGKTYTSKDSKFWKIPKFTFKMGYAFEE